MIMRGLVWCASAEGLIPKSYPSSGANKHSTWVALGGKLFDGGMEQVHHFRSYRDVRRKRRASRFGERW
jgi:hypothetical protein